MVFSRKPQFSFQKKKPKENRDEKYWWTEHSRQKMRHYRLTESRLKRVIRHPARIEEGILEGAIASMSPAESKTYSEIWVMYVVVKNTAPLHNKGEKIKIITAWRYPGKSPEGDPIPEQVLREVRKLL